MCAIGFLLYCGSSSSSLFLSSRFPSFFFLFFFPGFFLSLGSFFFFWVFYVFCSLFEIEYKKLKIHVFLNSTVKNSRSMWHKHVQLSKWEASL